MLRVLCVDRDGHFATLMNLYPRGWGKLAPHRDVGEPSLTLPQPKMYPVVSFSVGDTGR